MLTPHHTNVVQSLFDSVGAQRFRDVAEEVRASVIKAVGGWIMLRPAMFLEDRYLKYLGWALSDKVGLCRVHVLCLHAAAQ